MTNIELQRLLAELPSDALVLKRQYGKLGEFEGYHLVNINQVHLVKKDEGQTFAGQRLIALD